MSRCIAAAMAIALLLDAGGVVSAQSGARSADTATDPVDTYFDLMDFACSQAWSRAVATPAQGRRRVADLLRQGWNQMDATSQAQVTALPRAWADLQRRWGPRALPGGLLPPYSPVVSGHGRVASRRLVP